MQLSPHLAKRLLCTEALEGRCLLSGVGPPQPDAGGGDLVAEIVEVELDQEEADGDVTIDASQLPANVRGAFDARFPGAVVHEVEVEIEDGQTQYGLAARFQGQTIDVTVTPDGRITETETVIASEQLPAAVLERLTQQYPGAEIDEAAISAQGADETYEVAFTDAQGQHWEAELQLSAAEAPTTPDDGASVAPDPQAVPTESTVATTGTDTLAGVLQSASLASADGAQAAPQTTVMAASTGATPASPDDLERRAAWAALAIGQTASSHVVHALEALTTAAAAGTGGALAAATWLPELAGVVTDAMPFDAAALEQSLEQILAQVDALADSVVAEAVESRFAPRVALLVAAIAATHVAVFYARRNKGGPILVFNGATSTWSWVLGSTVSASPTRKAS